MHIINSYGLNDCLNIIAIRLKQSGKDVYVRGLNTKELHPCFISLSDPQSRTLLYPKRGNNPFASLAETMWVLSGSNKIDWLSKFLPRAKDFSDDGGITWRGGYGPRLRNWDNNDQIKFVQRQLIKDQSCRQAIISLWDPAREIPMQEIGTKDWPCSNWLHFLIRDNALDLTVVMRSNDAIFGWSGVNVYEWTVLQEVMAKSLGIPVGMYYHLSDSMHIYEQHYDKLDHLIKDYVPISSYEDMPVFEFAMLPKIDVSAILDNTVLTALTGQNFLNVYLADTEKLCNNVENNNVDFNCYTFTDIMEINRILIYYLQNKDNPNIEKHQEFLRQLPFTDLKVAIHYYVLKNWFKQKDIGLELIKACINDCKSAC